MPESLPRPAQNINKHVRFTSNVLRSIGVANDAICLLAAFFLAILIYRATSAQYFDRTIHETAAIVLGINFFLIRISRDSYSAFRGQGDDVGEGAMLDFLVAALLTAFTIILFDVLTDLSRGLAFLYILVSLALLFLSRIGFRKIAWWLMDLGYIGQRVVIYGADRDVANRVMELLTIERLPHLKIIGFADDRKTRTDQSPIGSANFVGGFPELLKMAQDGELDQVIIALPKVQQARLDSIIDRLSAAAIDVCCMPREILELRSSYRMSFIGSLPVLSLWQRPIRDLDVLAKEVQDRLLALVALILLSPVMVLTAIAIKLESRGDALFVQQRFGFNNLAIGIYKFRSMYADQQDISGAERTLKDDERVTKVGRIIRRLSIDELPQLFNVLRGEMSLVGPRPHATQMRVGDKFYFDAVEGYAARHRVKPGITGLAQVRGLRGEIATIERAKKRVEYDTYYIDHWSPLLDLRIILETVFMIVWDRNAY
jgi:Undecaprenyl-phosphate glucose phosphotransferase